MMRLHGSSDNVKPAFVPKSGCRCLQTSPAVQPTRKAAVPASISPDPGVGTGNQAAPSSDAGIGRIVPGLDYGDDFGGRRT